MSFAIKVSMVYGRRWGGADGGGADQGRPFAGQAFVEFENVESVELALGLNGKDSPRHIWMLPHNTVLRTIPRSLHSKTAPRTCMCVTMCAQTRLSRVKRMAR